MACIVTMHEQRKVLSSNPPQVRPTDFCVCREGFQGSYYCSLAETRSFVSTIRPSSPSLFGRQPNEVQLRRKGRPPINFDWVEEAV